MIRDKETRLFPENKVELTEAGKTALQRKEEKQAATVQEQKMAEPNPLPLNGWYLRLHQNYPDAVVSTYPMSYDNRSPAMLPSHIHAWIAEVFEHPTGQVIARGHGYASEEEDAEEVKQTGLSQWMWQRAEERAEIAAISRVVPLGLEPPGSALSKEVSLE